MLLHRAAVGHSNVWPDTRGALRVNCQPAVRARAREREISALTCAETLPAVLGRFDSSYMEMKQLSEGGCVGEGGGNGNGSTSLRQMV